MLKGIDSLHQGSGYQIAEGISSLGSWTGSIGYAISVKRTRHSRKATLACAGSPGRFEEDIVTSPSRVYPKKAGAYRTTSSSRIGLIDELVHAVPSG
jgi:hypothetical protein